ncbi:AP-3 complex subunit delta [Argentina anserina]|uniref:AP-3 complex subunit delta n=1 Tax=Argentina anserina TaxID=57926 RepID=UPI002176506D|nr:AP-3 complex subunit delta [Potentilla anserina]
MAGFSVMDSLFQRTLDDLIKGLRLHLTGESSSFLSKALDEIRREAKSTDPDTKSTALLKLTYLSSLYFYDMSFAAFHVVELLSSTRFSHKKVAYHAASHSFHDSTPVLVLITHQLRKDLASSNEFEVSLALECLSRIATVDLARDLSQQCFTLLASAKMMVRKKATIVVLRVFDKYPDSVGVCFKRLVENLDSSDSQLVAVAVGVLCELAMKDPGSYLPLAPEFYKILVDSKNNWVLIKVLKIFAKLAPLEPRLAKRVVEPICEHMRRTGAKSLLFECIRTVVGSLSDYDHAVRLAVVKIREMLVDDDPNLKYLGLQALSVVAPKHLWAVVENKEAVINSLSDVDPNIKLESLRLVMAMVSESNVAEICRVLVNYALKSDPEFCNLTLGSILSTCCRNVYEIIIDFDWYVSLLGEMSRMPHCQKGEEIEKQLIDIGLRVKDVRPELVRVSCDLLIDPALLGNPFLHRILSAAAWLSGEYVEFSVNPFELMEALFQPRTSLLPPLIKAIYIQSAFKVLIFCLNSYLLQRGNAASSSYPDKLVPDVPGLFSQQDSTGCSDLASSDASVHAKPDEGLFGSFSVEFGREGTSTCGQAPAFASASLKDDFTHECITNLLNRVELAVVPLTGSYDVEIIERARNVLCFIELIKPQMPECLVQKEESSDREEVEASKIVKFMHDAFLNDLGPVSVCAQERVSVPDGLVLVENLEDLETICGDVQLPSLNSFAHGSSHFEEMPSVSIPTFQSNEEPGPSNESTSLLVEHRKQHDLYYLPAEKKDGDYPLANDPQLQANANDDKYLAKLTEQLLVPKKKPTHAKPRPVVVKLDGDEVRVATDRRPQEDLLSGTVRDVLLGSETEPTTKSSTKRKGKEKLNVKSATEIKAGDVEKQDLGNSSLRKSKHHSHSKGRRHRSPGKKGDERPENGQKVKPKSSGRHKARQRADAPLNVVSQTPVIPDFLL